MVSYKEQEKADYDKKQTKFQNGAVVPNTNKYAKEIIEAKHDKKYLCPFCLEENYIYRFKKEHGFYVCPVCNNSMFLSTLVLKMDIPKFAEWVYGYRVNGFFQKIYPNFGAWCKKLFELGISYEFWENYKRLKGDNTQQENEEIENE